jgi:uncharacterized protein YbaR (Trm112 family)
VVLDVGSPLLDCPFCRTTLYLCPRGPLAYYMEPERRPKDGEETLVHLPFWRFRGIRYRLKNSKVHGTLVDATTPASAALPAGATLGIRPQVVPLTLLGDGRKALPASVGQEEALQAAFTRVKMAEAERPELERFIGETECLIHAPFFLAPNRSGEGGSLSGAWAGSTLRHTLEPEAYARLEEESRRPRATVSMRFLTLVCPECAGRLPAVTDAVAVVCNGCQRAWRIAGQSYQPLRYSVWRTADPGPDGRFLPFWLMELQLGGLSLANRAEMRRALIPYQQPPASWEQMAPQLAVPAFKLNPAVLVRLAGNISLAPYDRPEAAREFRRGEQAESVRLPLAEAAQALKVVLADLCTRNRNLAPLVPGAHLKITRAGLVFLPFRRQGRDFVEPFSNQAVAAAALELGLGL